MAAQVVEKVLVAGQAGVNGAQPSQHVVHILRDDQAGIQGDELFAGQFR
jgi:hypothetical protein